MISAVHTLLETVQPMMFWVWAMAIVALVLGFVALLFGMVPRFGNAGEAVHARRPWPLYALVGLALLVSGVLLGRWFAMPTGAESDVAIPDATASAPAPDSGLGPLVAQLEERIRKDPSDPEGWRLLGSSRFQMGDYAGAADAYAQAVERNPQSADDLSALGEARVMAGGGTVSADARTALGAALAIDRKDARARYYMAVAREQDGDVKGAVADWIALVRDSPADETWTSELRRIITQKGAAAGIDVPADIALAEPAPPPGPSAGQVADAAAMAPGDQQAMIRGMVDRLDARLKTAPGDIAGWERLIRARLVLGEQDKAAAALATARAQFKGDPAALARLEAAAGG